MASRHGLVEWLRQPLNHLAKCFLVFFFHVLRALLAWLWVHFDYIDDTLDYDIFTRNIIPQDFKVSLSSWRLVFQIFSFPLCSHSYLYDFDLAEVEISLLGFSKLGPQLRSRSPFLVLVS